MPVGKVDARGQPEGRGNQAQKRVGRLEEGRSGRRGADHHRVQCGMPAEISTGAATGRHHRASVISQAFTRASMLTAPKRPDVPPWPADILVANRTSLRSVLVARSRATHLAASWTPTWLS